MHAILYVKLQKHILFLSKLHPWCDYRAFSSTPFPFVSFVWSLFTQEWYSQYSLHLPGKGIRAKRDFLYSAAISAASFLSHWDQCPKNRWIVTSSICVKEKEEHVLCPWEEHSVKDSGMASSFSNLASCEEARLLKKKDLKREFSAWNNLATAKKSFALFLPSVTTWLQRSSSIQWADERTCNTVLCMSGESLWQYLLLHGRGHDTKHEHGKHLPEKLHTSKSEAFKGNWTRILFSFAQFIYFPS